MAVLAMMGFARAFPGMVNQLGHIGFSAPPRLWPSKLEAGAEAHLTLSIR